MLKKIKKCDLSIILLITVITTVKTTNSQCSFINCAAGSYHSIAIKSDSTVWAWGFNKFGQLGNGKQNICHITPAKVKGSSGVGYLNNIIKIACGYYHTIALKSDSTVWAWGYNAYGQLGNGSYQNKLTPVQVLGPGGIGYLDSIIDIAAGPYHSVALKSDGTVWTWGDNHYGELGDGTTIRRTTPVQVVGPDSIGYLDSIIAIAAGGAKTIGVGTPTATGYFTVALKSDGTVWTWGANGYGTLGDGTDTTRHIPVQVVGPCGVGYLDSITYIDANWLHVVCIKSDSTVWAWGYNYDGVLGTDTLAYSYIPIQILGPDSINPLDNIIKIATSYSTVLALNSDSNLLVWGSNIGNGTDSTHYIPVYLIKPDDTLYFDSIVGISCGYDHKIIIKADSTVWTWGLNQTYQLGDGTDTNRFKPVQVTGSDSCEHLQGIIYSDGGYSHTAALKSDSTVWTWGFNNYGQLGCSNYSREKNPVEVVGPDSIGYLDSIINIDGGCRHTIALKNNGTVWGWGQGKFGNGTALLFRATPIQAIDPSGIGYLDSIVKISCSGFQSIVLKVDSTVWTLDDTPKQIHFDSTHYLDSIIDVKGGGTFKLFLKADSTVLAMGDNSYGQLGDGTDTNRCTPTQVLGPGGAGYLNNVVAIAAGEYHSLALKSDGSVWAWGRNNYGQLGDGTDTNRYTPIQVLGPGGVGYLNNIIAIAAGGYHSIALKSDSSVLTWGRNNSGQLGIGISIGTFRTIKNPIQVLNSDSMGYLDSIIKIAAGMEHSLALKSDSTLWAWGNNAYGQLGDGTDSSRNLPIQVQCSTSLSIKYNGESIAKPKIEIFPNPFNNYCIIKAYSNLELQIFDIMGRRIFKLNNVNLENKKLNENMPILLIWKPENSITSGIYFICAILSDGSFFTKKVIFLK